MPDHQPRSTSNMAAELVRDSQKTSRTLAIPAGLTHDEAVKWVARWQGKGERLAQFVVYH